MGLMINDLTVGEVVEISLVVKAAIARETKAKKPYLQVDFYDGVDTISGNYWDWLSGSIPAVNTILDVTAQVTEWQGAKQLNIKSMRNNTTKILADFAPTTNINLSDVYKDAYALACTIKHQFLRDLTLTIMEDYRDKWLTVPGAVSVHHAYIGGTLVHSYSVACLADAMAKEIPEADRDLCVAGALLHDFGKLFTYALNGVTIVMTDNGQLYEHLVMGAEKLSQIAANKGLLNSSNEETLRLLRHIVLSHHGCLEYGSPVVPMCIEAHIVNRADGLDATVEQIRAAARKAPAGSIWTDRLYTLSNKAQLVPGYVGAALAEENYNE